MHMITDAEMQQLAVDYPFSLHESLLAYIAYEESVLNECSEMHQCADSIVPLTQCTGAKVHAYY
jgi:hypothetical protein